MTFWPSSTVRQKGIIRDFCFGLPDGNPYTRAPKERTLPFETAIIERYREERVRWKKRW